MTKSLTNPDREFYESTWNTAILKHQAPIVRRLDNAIHWIKLYPVDNAIRFAITYPPDSDLSVGQRYPPFYIQLGSEVF